MRINRNQFRAWDKINKRFFYQGLILGNKETRFEKTQSVGKLEEWKQFTGLFDKV